MTGWWIVLAVGWILVGVCIGPLIGRGIRLADRRTRRPDDGRIGR